MINSTLIAQAEVGNPKNVQKMHTLKYYALQLKFGMKSEHTEMKSSSF